MHLIRGNQAQKAFTDHVPSLTGQPFNVPITITGYAFVVVSACQIVPLDSSDVLATWNEPSSVMRLINLEEGEGVKIVPQGQGVIYTPFATQLSPGVLTSPGGLGVSISVPTELAGGVLLVDMRDGSGVSYPLTQWFWKIGTMLWNMTTRPPDLSFMVPPPVIQPGFNMSGPVQNTSFNMSDIGHANGGYFLAGARTTVTNKLKPYPITKSGVGDTSLPICVMSSTVLSTGSFYNWLFSFAELPAHPAIIFQENGVIAAFDWSLAVKTLYTVVPQQFINAVQDTWKARFTFYFPNWVPAAANDIYFNVQPDFIQSANGVRVSGGYPPKCFAAAAGTAGVILTPIGIPLPPPRATNLQPLG